MIWMLRGTTDKFKGPIGRRRAVGNECFPVNEAVRNSAHKKNQYDEPNEESSMSHPSPSTMRRLCFLYAFNTSEVN